MSGEAETAFKKAAQHALALTNEQLSALIQTGQFSEVEHDG